MAYSNQLRDGKVYSDVNGHLSFKRNICLYHSLALKPTNTGFKFRPTRKVKLKVLNENNQS